jgi:hypothetical protein
VVGCTTGSREEVPGERKPVIRDDDDDYYDDTKMDIYEVVTKSFRTESITKYTLTFGITRSEAT